MSEQAVATKRTPPASWQPQEETLTGLDVSQPLASAAPEKFIPVDRSAITSRTLEKLFDTAHRPLATVVVRYMCAIRQAESARMLDELVSAYDDFNPDDETVNLTELTADEKKKQLEDLKEKVIDLIESANYNEITPAELQQIFEKDSPMGFLAEVDLSEYDFHLLYYRGAIKDQIKVKSWKTLYLREKSVEIPAYRRLFLGLKLKPKEARIAELVGKGMSRRKAERFVKSVRNQQLLEGVSEHTVHLKIFRRIPRGELEILFPNARIRFSLFDKLWLWVGSGGSSAAAIVMAAIKILSPLALINPYVLLGTAGGAIGAVFRSFSNILNTRTRYMAQLAKSLYFHSIGANQSVLALLNDDAEEEDLNEAILTYAMLLRHGHRGLDAAKSEAIKFLKDEFDVDVDFEISDGCNHLRKLGLLVEDGQGHLHIRDLEDARVHLAEAWQAIPLWNR